LKENKQTFNLSKGFTRAEVQNKPPTAFRPFDTFIAEHQSTRREVFPRKQKVFDRGGINVSSPTDDRIFSSSRGCFSRNRHRYNPLKYHVESITRDKIEQFSLLGSAHNNSVLCPLFVYPIEFGKPHVGN
jgi:hypothetical protein